MEPLLIMKTANHVLEGWGNCLVDIGREPPFEIIEEFKLTLDEATDERPLQQLFAASPVLLGPLAPPGRNYWCLDRPRLGAEYVPDFLLASITSVGFKWVAIELESPNAKALNKAGLPAKKLNEALGQVRNWRAWLTDNVSYAREARGLKDIDGNCEAFVIIGRRNTLDPRRIKEYKGTSSNGITVMSYDRLYDTVKNSAY